MKLKIRAMSSEAKASAYIVGSLPFFVFTIVWMLNPAYLAGFFSEPRLMIAGIVGLIWMIIGAFIMSDRKSVESGKSVSVVVDIGGRRIIKKNIMKSIQN